MKRFILPGLVTLAGAVLIALLISGVASQGTDSSLDAALSRGQRPPAPVPGMALPVLGSNQRLALAGLRGKVVVLNVYASWCDACKAEADVLNRAQRRLAGHNATVLGVTYLDNSDDTSRYDRRYGVRYPVIRDVSGNFVHAYGTTQVPETFVIDRSGRVAALRRFQVDSSWLDAQIRTLIPGAA